MSNDPESKSVLNEILARPYLVVAMSYLLRERPDCLGEDSDAHLSCLQPGDWMLQLQSFLGGLAGIVSRYEVARHEAAAHQGSGVELEQQGWNLMTSFARLAAIALAAVEVYAEYGAWGANEDAPAIWRPGEEEALDLVMDTRAQQVASSSPAADKALTLDQWGAQLTDLLTWIKVAAVQGDTTEFRRHAANVGALAMAALEATHVDPQDQPEASGE